MESSDGHVFGTAGNEREHCNMTLEDCAGWMMMWWGLLSIYSLRLISQTLWCWWGLSFFLRFHVPLSYMLFLRARYVLLPLAPEISPLIPIPLLSFPTQGISSISIWRTMMSSTEGEMTYVSRPSIPISCYPARLSLLTWKLKTKENLAGNIILDSGSGFMSLWIFSLQCSISC